ncbi:MAG: hypothetical protein DWG76_05050 [Chloroflexi bacterium]|nr:hypothetical protein [Chloroflexota bacterium]
MPTLARRAVEKTKSWLPEAAALAGAIVSFLQSRHYALTQLSVLDEGAYLLKGFWFATGQYVPYQDYGPFTNHMPLAFLIPGYVQAWFGPGLGVARAFALLLGLVFLVGLWLLSRRWGSRWWAAAAVWVFALNPAVIKIYSVGVSQGLIAAMLVWTLYLALGAERPTWQIALGSGLAGLMALTRLNMTPVLFFVIVYVFWEHGRYRGLIAAGFGVGIWLIGHAVYWPNILQMWANYTPAALTPFLDDWRIPVEALPSWESGASLHGRWLSLLEALRFNFVPLAAALGAGLMWPKRTDWRNESQWRIGIFLATLFTLLLAMHALASLGGDYCVSCFPLYTSFFSSLAVLLFIHVWAQRTPGNVVESRKAAIAVLLLLPAAVGYGASVLAGARFAPNTWVRWLLIRELPRFDRLRILPGRVPVWGLLENRFGWEYADAFRIVQNGLGYALAVLAGLVVGLFLIWVVRTSQGRWAWVPKSFSIRAIGALLVAGLLLSPTPVLGGGYRTYDCDSNVVDAYERLGAELDEILPEGALVFWRGGRSAVPLLYLDDVRAYPTQLNGDYTYRLAGEADQLERYGLWGPALLDDWLRGADFVLVEQDLYRTWLQAAIENGPYDMVATTAPLADCAPRSEVLVFVYQP